MEHLPEFVPYFSRAYDAPARLHHAGQTIPEEERSQHGCQQGCSWGTLLFGLARLRLMKRLIDDNPECLILSVNLALAHLQLPHATHTERHHPNFAAHAADDNTMTFRTRMPHAQA